MIFLLKKATKTKLNQTSILEYEFSELNWFGHGKQQN